MSLHGASGVTDGISANCGLMDSEFDDSARLANDPGEGIGGFVCNWIVAVVLLDLVLRDR